MRICFINTAPVMSGAEGFRLFFQKNGIQKPGFGQIAGRMAVFLLLFLTGKIWAQPNCEPVCKPTEHFNMLPTAPAAAPTITPADVLSPPLCVGNHTVTIFNQALTAQIPQPLVGGFYVGSWRWAKVTYSGSGLTCMTKVFFDDNTPPTIACKDTLVSCNTPLDTATLGRPVVSDNISGQFWLKSNLSFTDVVTAVGACSDNFLQKINRRWETFDQSGNTATCIQKIEVKRPVLDDVEFPSDVDIPACMGKSKDNLALTGQPLINGRPITDPACGFTVSRHDGISSLCGTTDTTWERHWQVILPQPCTGIKDTLFGLQYITKMDTTHPTLLCPMDMTVGFVSGECFGNVTLPPVYANDFCAGIIQAIPSWYYGSGIGVFENIPAGTYDITYTAADCNNESTCQLKLTVEDQQPPEIECRTKVPVMLGANGKASVPAKVFLLNYSDNCTNDFVFSIDDGSGIFKPDLEVDCSDIGTLVATVRVAEYGNLNSFAECMVTVQVIDKMKPVVKCPADLAVSCSDPNLFNLNAFGQPSITDNCSVADVQYSEKKEISAMCGDGFIVRKWIATDPSGNKDSCSQKITVVLDKPFSAANIVWPKDTVIFDCSAAVDPSLFPAAYKEPSFKGVFCGMPVFSKTDAVYDGGKPACWKIVRKWKVINWCGYNQQTGSPSWEYYQTIAVMDSIKPVMHLPADMTVSLGATCTTGPVTASATATDCSVNITWKQYLLNGTKNPYATNANSPNLSGNYPAGTTTVKVICSDGCGNEAVGLWKVTVKDLKAPTPVCVNGLSVNLSKMGDNIFMAMVNAKDFNQSSTDNCTAAADLKFTIRKADPNATGPATETVVSFDCNDLGTQIVELWVTDLAGNSDYCTTYIIVQDNKGWCMTNTSKITGSIKTDMGEMLENAKIELMNNAAVVPVATSAQGNFALQNLSIGQDYAVHPVKNDDPANGISTFDLIAIQKHVLGIAPFTSPWQYIAGDINRNGSVTTFDMIELRKLVLGVYTEFPQNSSWRFVESGFHFPDPANPLASAFPEMKMVPLTLTGATADFTAIKIGDLNHTATANDGLNGSADDRGELPEIPFFFHEKEWAAGETIDLPLRVSDFKKVEGLQFTLEFDPTTLAFDDIFSENLPGFSPANIGAARLDEGLLTFSWNTPAAESTGLELGDDAPIFTLRMHTLRAGKLSESMKLNSRLTAAEAWEIGDKRKKPTLAFRQKDGATTAPTAGNELMQNQPNPFSDQTAIGFQLAENQEVALKIFDLSGRLVFSETAEATAGPNEFWLDKSSLPGRGVYVYRVETATWSASRKLIVE